MTVWTGHPAVSDAHSCDDCSSGSQAETLSTAVWRLSTPHCSYWTLRRLKHRDQLMSEYPSTYPSITYLSEYLPHNVSTFQHSACNPREAQVPYDGAFALVHCCLRAKTTTPEFPVMLVCFPTYTLLLGTQLGALSS